MELYFLRHGRRIDHDPTSTALHEPYHDYDPLVSLTAVEQLKAAAAEIASLSSQFPDPPGETTVRKNIYIHFLPYLRCCQTADLLVLDLRAVLAERFPRYKVRYNLLADFALSEWIHVRMKHKPPFYDSNDAYQMYTPNLKLMKNRGCCSNFRPTNTLGHWNGHDLSYKDYQTNCKEYFKRLVATYNRPAITGASSTSAVATRAAVAAAGADPTQTSAPQSSAPAAADSARVSAAAGASAHASAHAPAASAHASTHAPHAPAASASASAAPPPGDLIIVISHGYFINNLLLFFVNHPIFDEIPECGINFAARENGQWVLRQDCLGLFGLPDIDTTLNLDDDIVYYKTNFIKRNELDPDAHPLDTNQAQPRPLFRIRRSTKSVQTLQSQALAQGARGGGSAGGGSAGSHDGRGSAHGGSHEKFPELVLNNPICPAAKNWLPRTAKLFEIKQDFKLKAMNMDCFKPDFDITKPPHRPPTPEISPSSYPTRNNSVIDLSKIVHEPMKLRYSTTADIPIERLNSKVNSQINLAQFQRFPSNSSGLLLSEFPKFKRAASGASSANFGAAGTNFGAAGGNSSAAGGNFGASGLNFGVSASAPGSGPGSASQTAPVSRAGTPPQVDQMNTVGDADLSDNESIDSNDPPPFTRSKLLKYKQQQALQGGSSILALYQKQQQQDEKFSLNFKKVPSREANSTPVGFYKKNIFYNLEDDSDSDDVSSVEELYLWFGQNRK